MTFSLTSCPGAARQTLYSLYACYGLCRSGKGIRSCTQTCGGCVSGIHKKWSSTPDSLKPDPSSRCKQCTGLVRPIHGRPMIVVTVDRGKLQVAPSFYYHGDCLPWGDSYDQDGHQGANGMVDYHNELQIISHFLPFLMGFRIPGCV